MTDPKFRKDHPVRVQQDAASMLRGFTGKIESVDVTKEGKFTYAVWLDRAAHSRNPRTYEFTENELEAIPERGPRFGVDGEVSIRSKSGIPILYRNRHGVVEAAYTGPDGACRYDVKLDDTGVVYAACPEGNLKKRVPDVDHELEVDSPRPAGHVADLIRDLEKWAKQREAKNRKVQTLRTTIAYLVEYRAMLIERRLLARREGS